MLCYVMYSELNFALEFFRIVYCTVPFSQKKKTPIVQQPPAYILIQII